MNKYKILFVDDEEIVRQALRRALALAPEDISARHHLSLVYMARGEQEAAVRELERILVIKPDNLSAQLDLAILSLSRGEFETALNRLDTVLQKDTNNPRARFYHAVVLDGLERKNEAREILEILARETSGKYTERARRYLEERKSGQFAT